MVRIKLEAFLVYVVAGAAGNHEVQSLRRCAGAGRPSCQARSKWSTTCTRRDMIQVPATFVNRLKFTKICATFGRLPFRLGTKEPRRLSTVAAAGQRMDLDGQYA